MVMSSFFNMADLLKQGNEDVALEAIEFQINTKFADSIRDVYQNIINYREAQRGNRNIVRDVIEYAADTMDKEFPKIWKQYINLSLKGISFSQCPTFFFAMCPHIGSDKDLAKIADSATGNQHYSSNIDFSNKTYEEIKKVAASFDRKKGRIGVTQALKRDIYMDFYFDPYVAFLTKDTLNVNLDYMTAEELTAITLHEVGHMMSLLEHCADMYFNLSLNIKIANSFAKTAPLPEKLKAVKEIIKNKQFAASLSENGKLKPQEADAAVKAADTMINFDKDDNYNDSSYSFWTTILNFFITAVYMAYTVIGWFWSPITSFIFQLVQDLSIAWTRDFIQKGGVNDPKYSDYMANKTVAFNWERWADEYVTRYGYGSHLNSGLTKLFDFMHKTQMFSGMNDKGVDVWIRNSSMPMYLSFVMSSFISFVMGGNLDDGFGIYESQIDRLKRVIQDTANVFKRNDLPQEVMEKYLVEFERCKKSLDDVGAVRRCEHLFAIVHRCIMSFVDPVQLGNRLFRGNIKAEYAQLANDIDDLKSNQLFYNAAKINSILNKRR